VIVALGILLCHSTQRFWRWRNGRGGWNPTLATYNIFYAFFILDGLQYIYVGAWRIVLLRDYYEAPGLILTGVGQVGPYLAAALYGRRRLFKVMERRFDTTRRDLDRAFIAELADDSEIKWGQERWIHHGRNLVDEYVERRDYR
jgi:hypothetical protein